MALRKHLRRYWIEFSGDPEARPMGVRIGCGVTALDYEDALAMLRETIFVDHNLEVARCVEDVDVSTLDAGHVLPNMGDVTARGIWFPAGLY